MKLMLVVVISVISATTLAPIQMGGGPNKDTEVRKELLKVFSDLNGAISKRDRAALERIYAEEFQFIHSTGAIVNKTAQINGVMSNDPISSSPIPTPSFDQLLLYGDVAILRGPGRGVAGTSIYAKKGGRWQIVQVQGTRLPPERKPIQLDAKVLDLYLGRYEFGPGAYATVTKEGDALKWQAGGRPKVTLAPLSDVRFYAKENDAEMTFYKDDKGHVTDVILRLGSCQDTKAKRVQ